jgi:succinate dehydrogenase/fumarate reductase flavoprotein subunit
LIVDEETFAYPQAGHRLLDGWETIAEMEHDLNLPPASLERTLAGYNRDATDGVDRRFHKHSDYLKPLDVGPWASFDLSFTRSPYVLLTLGGLRTSLNGEALDAHGAPIPGRYAAGACAAHLPRDGKGYASGLSLAPGSLFGRTAGRHAAGVKAAIA